MENIHLQRKSEVSEQLLTAVSSPAFTTRTVTRRPTIDAQLRISTSVCENASHKALTEPLSQLKYTTLHPELQVAIFTKTMLASPTPPSPSPKKRPTHPSLRKQKPPCTYHIQHTISPPITNNKATTQKLATATATATPQFPRPHHLQSPSKRERSLSMGEDVSHFRSRINGNS